MHLRNIKKHFSTTVLSRSENQAFGIGKYAIDFMKNGNPSQKVKFKNRF